MDRINEIFEAQPALFDGPFATGETGAGRIQVRRLSYTYPGASQPALRDVDLVIEPGDVVVVVGRTGSGKTTLLELLARLLKAPRGSIFLDGQDVVGLPLSAVRSRVAWAPQDAFLFSRTLEENVGLARPEAPRAEIHEALSLACFEVEDKAGFPDGLDTMLGERGITLSGGQRQRTTLARALVSRRPILLLDDTLSAVDTETETRILDALLKNGAERTLVIATHRLACAARADRILVLDEGQLVETGTEAELLERKGIYAAMHRRQRIRDDLQKAHPSGSWSP